MPSLWEEQAKRPMVTFLPWPSAGDAIVIAKNPINRMSGLNFIVWAM